MANLAAPTPNRMLNENLVDVTTGKIKASILPTLADTAAAVCTAFTVSSGGTPGTTLAAQTLPGTLTDSTGGSASTTLAAITAGAEYAQADITAIKNALASLAAQHALVLAQLTVLKNSVTSLGTQHNAVLTSLKNAGIMASA